MKYAKLNFFITIKICSGASGLVYLYTKILKVNLFAFAYRLFHEDFSSVDGTLHGTIWCYMVFIYSQPFAISFIELYIVMFKLHIF